MMGQCVFMANFIQRGGKCKYETAVHAGRYVSQLDSREVLFSLVFFLLIACILNRAQEARSKKVLKIGFQNI